MSVMVVVQDHHVVKALRQLKRKLGKAGVLREVRKRAAYEKPSDRRRRQVNTGRRRLRKTEAVTAERPIDSGLVWGGMKWRRQGSNL